MNILLLRLDGGGGAPLLFLGGDGGSGKESRSDDSWLTKIG